VTCRCCQDRVADIAAFFEAAQRRVPSRAPASAIVYTLKRDTADEVAAALTRKGADCTRVADRAYNTVIYCLQRLMVPMLELPSGHWMSGPAAGGSAPPI
jgi:hypothetical protein